MDTAHLARFFPCLVFLIAFLVGSIPFGLLVARVFHVSDLTSRGSGNIGATNVSRIVGFWPAGAVTFFLDVGKGALVVFLLGSPWLRGTWEQWTGGADLGVFGAAGELSALSVWTAGFFTVAGHCYSPWVHFKGGKGVATGFGVLLVLSPISAAAGIAGFGLTFLDKRIGSLSSLVGLTTAAVAYLVLNPVGIHLWMGAALVLLILLRHEANLDALLEGRESVF